MKADNSTVSVRSLFSDIKAGVFGAPFRRVFVSVREFTCVVPLEKDAESCA